jgi:hypothetical protein
MNYNQKTGMLKASNFSAEGYAGHGLGKNNPEMEHVKNIGPLPKGKYLIGKPYDSPNTGPFTLPLIPDPSNKMYGRGDFKIHGDSINAPGTASHGCIILPRNIRMQINQSPDKYLIVE